MDLPVRQSVTSIQSLDLRTTSCLSTSPSLLLFQAMSKQHEEPLTVSCVLPGEKHSELSLVL